MDKINVDFSGWIERGIDLFKNNLSVLIVSSLIAGLLSAFTGGILAGPMAAGMMLIVLRLLRGQPAEVNDLFKGFEYFLQSFLLLVVCVAIWIGVVVVLSVIPCVGRPVAAIVGLVVPAFMLFGILFIVDQKLEFWPAIMKTVELVKANPAPFAAFLMVCTFIGMVGGVLCGIGWIATWPIELCILVVAYEALFAEEGKTIDVPAEEVVSEEPPAE